MNVYLIGIGGSAAAYLVDLAKAYDYKVSGSDAVESEAITAVRAKKIKVFVPHNPLAITDAIDEVWYSAAITPHSAGYAELAQAKFHGIPTLTFAQAAARFFNRAERRIAVAGTHGKSTTTAMVGWILEKAGLNPTVAVGAELSVWNGNSRIGDPDLFVIEADENARRFLEYRPTHAIVTNLDLDHFDTYPTEKGLVEAYGQFIQSTSQALVINGHDERLRKAATNYKQQLLSYGVVSHHHKLDLSIESIDQSGGESQSIRALIRPLNVSLSLRVAGMHNLLNASAAILLCSTLGVDPERAAHALSTFPGVARRFEYIGHGQAGQEIRDDYGHHPVEIEATLQGARQFYSDRPIVLIFQAHQAGRLRRLLDQTAAALAKADQVILLPVYLVEGREDPEDVALATSEALAKAAKAKGAKVELAKDYESAAALVKKIAPAKSLILTMGATDVWKVSRMLVKKSS